jgi:Fe2+ or Zn2+ uptake regulation protein
MTEVTAGPGAALWDPRADDHHHLVCRSCGAVEDLDAPVAQTGSGAPRAGGAFGPTGARSS